MCLGGVCIQKKFKEWSPESNKTTHLTKIFRTEACLCGWVGIIFFLIHMREEQSSGAYEGKISNVVTGVGGKPCAGDFGMYLNVAHFFAQKKIDVRSCRLSCPLPSLVP